jgi:hypothetical protein
MWVKPAKAGKTAQRARWRERQSALPCEHAFVMYADALLLLFELTDRGDERFQLAAARWHARFVLEAGLPLREAEGVRCSAGCVAPTGLSSAAACWPRSSERA